MIGTRKSRGQEAAEIILAAPQFADDVVRRHIHERPPHIDFGALLRARPWSPGESVALTAARAVYTVDGGPVLSDVIMKLDDDLQDRVLRAMRLACGLDERKAA